MSAIRIEHDFRGTRVYGTDKSQSSVIGALKDQGFKWSRNQGFWYLNSTWKYETRGDRIRRLQARFDSLGIPYGTDAGQKQEMPAQSAPESLAASAESAVPADTPHGEQEPAPAPAAIPVPASPEPPASPRQDAPEASAEAQAGDATAEDRPDAIAGSPEPEYEQQSLFGASAPKPPQGPTRRQRSVAQPGSAGEVRIDHSQTDTRVHGADPGNPDVSRLFRAFYFIWSEDEGCWHLGNGRRGDHDTWALLLGRRLEDLGYQVTWEGGQRPGAAPEASEPAAISTGAAADPAGPGRQVGTGHAPETHPAIPPTLPGAGLPAPDPARPAGVIRVEHRSAHTRVYGADAADLAVTEALTVEDFRASADGSYWHLPSEWDHRAREGRVSSLLGRLRGLDRPHELTGDPRAIRIEHDDAHIRVFGAGRHSEASVVIDDFGFMWSEDEDCWYLPEGWRGDRDRWASRLAGQLEDLGHNVTLSGHQPGIQPATQDTGQPVRAGTGIAAETESAATPDLPQGGAPLDGRPAQPTPGPTTVLPADPVMRPTATDMASSASAQEEVSSETVQEEQGAPAATEERQGQETPQAATTGSAAISESLASIPVDPRPYEGSRAQAMSGSLIIENDHRAWANARAQAGDAALPDEHPRVRQFTIAWQRVNAKGLDDGPGPAAACYHALAHAALALSSAIDRTSNAHEPEALDLIATHARKHSVRLRATADRMFSVSTQAGHYQGGRAQAEQGSRMIEKDYRGWIRTGSPLEAARDPRLWQHARRTEKAWHEVRRHGVADGPAAAAARYTELADAAQALADGYTVTLPSAALPSLLDLAEHARKHSTRLHATARAAAHAKGGGVSESQAERGVAPGGDAYGALPDGLATVTRQAYASQHRQPQRHSSQGNGHEGNRNASALQQDTPQDRSRG